MLCLGYLAFRTRDVDEAYSDSNAIIVGLIIITIALFILIPVYAMLETKNESVFTAFIISFTTTAVTFLITGYRVFEAHFDKIRNEEKRGLIDLLSIASNKMSQSSSTTTSNIQQRQQQQQPQEHEHQSLNLVERIVNSKELNNSKLNGSNNNNINNTEYLESERSPYESKNTLECSYVSRGVSALTREECNSSINMNKK